jgi:uncharacterized protein
MHADLELKPWFDVLAREIEDLEIVDIHTHVGLDDPAGLLMRGDELLDALNAINARGVVFPLKEPGGYKDANARVLEFAATTEGRLQVLGRVDPHDDPLGTALAALDAGAVGIKLHPRGEDFLLNDTRLDALFELADERRLPIVIHDGVGVEALGNHALDRARAHPGARLILAHCALLCLSWLWRELRDVDNIFVDTSWWNPSDLMACFRRLRHGQILFGSDAPFGHPTEGAIKAIRCGLQAGLDAEQLRVVLGGQAARLLDHDEPLDLGSPPDAHADALAPEVERVYAALLCSIEGMLRGDDPGQGVDVALAACEVAEEDPHREVLSSVRELLELAREQESPDPLRQQRTPGFDLVLIAATLARTPLAPVPVRTPSA